MDENGPKADHRSPRVRPQSALAPRVLCPGTQRARSLVGTPDGVSTSSTSSRTKRRFCSRACTSFARIATTRPDAQADFFLQPGRCTFARALSALQDSTIKVSVVPSSSCTWTKDNERLPLIGQRLPLIVTRCQPGRDNGGSTQVCVGPPCPSQRRAGQRKPSRPTDAGIGRIGVSMRSHHS